MPKTILDTLEQGMEKFTGAQRRVADYILKNPSEVAFMTIEKLAHHSGVSVATIMRLAYAQNYEGYSDMQKDLQKIVLQQVSPGVKLSANLKKLTNNKLLLQCAETQIENIRRTVGFISDEVAEKSVCMLLESKKIYTVGLRSSKSIASYLNEGLNRIGIDCELLMPETGRMLGQLARLDKDSLVIPISFPRYIRRTLEIATAAKERGAKVLAITDGRSSPLAGIADLFIPCAFATLSFHSSTLGGIFAADYLITALSLLDPGKAKRELDGIERLLQQFGSNILK